jgi:hypothetical protein
MPRAAMTLKTTTKTELNTANGKRPSASDKALASATVHTEKPEPAPAQYSKEFEFLRGDRPLKSRGQAILDAKSAA